MTAFIFSPFLVIVRFQLRFFIGRLRARFGRGRRLVRSRFVVTAGAIDFQSWFVRYRLPR
ncbi:MAG: hypothetical protein KIT69_11410 [Propionibacteriaceae bacterium]|nr:hypothetical protein [Propionibacteriaceae bacterium]